MKRPDPVTWCPLSRKDALVVTRHLSLQDLLPPPSPVDGEIQSTYGSQCWWPHARSYLSKHVEPVSPQQIDDSQQKDEHVEA